MSERVTMPALGESVTEGTVTRWLKQVGDSVEADEPLLEVSTDKVDTEIPSPMAGVLEEILVGEDETVAVGADLAVLGDGSGAGASDSSSQQAPAAEPEPAPAEPAPAAEPAAAEPAPAAAAPAAAEPAAGGEGTTVTMPALGESVTEGTVTRWLKAEGDTVEVDEPLLEVSTDKVDTEIPSPVAGTVQKILVGEDETVAVGAALALVGSGAAPAAAPPAAPEPEAQPAAQPAAEPQQPAQQDAPAHAVLDDDPAPGGYGAPTLADELGEVEGARQEAEEKTAPAAQPTHVAQDKAAPEAPEPSAPAKPDASEPSAPQPDAPKADAGQAAGGDTSAYVTPLVRKLAAEHGVDLASLTGTGVGGRVRKQDVLDAAAKAAEQAAQPEPEPAAAPAPAASAPSSGSRAGVPASVSAKRGTTEKMSRLRKVIAQRMVESLQTSAQLTTVVEVDVTKVARLRDRAKREFESREGVKLSFLPFFALAAVEALKANPTVNASVEGDQIVYHAQENLGIAVDTERGLLVPVIRDAGDLNIAGIARKVSDLADRTRNNKITPDELGGGTFTLTNTGSRGALFDTPIINQPQVAILGTGSVVRRPVVVKDPDGGDTIAIRSMIYLALSYDHRIVDGADAARFLVAMKTRLEEGAFDADLGL
ncbi:MAG TPA: 2-oxoglutarate dehydrogenase, E2 component, dihydrolipoamide succinyltransferase [Actinomycetales bacterium]